MNSGHELKIHGWASEIIKTIQLLIVAAHH